MTSINVNSVATDYTDKARMELIIRVNPCNLWLKILIYNDTNYDKQQ